MITTKTWDYQNSKLVHLINHCIPSALYCAWKEQNQEVEKKVLKN